MKAFGPARSVFTLPAMCLALLSSVALASLCSMPNELAGCIATASVFPLASALSPLVCLYLLARAARVPALYPMSGGHCSLQRASP